MLKITTQSENGSSTTLRLEGRLVGPWVSALREACEEPLGEGRRVNLDLGELSFAGSEGIKLLKELKGRGATFIRPTRFIGELLKEAGTG